MRRLDFLLLFWMVTMFCACKQRPKGGPILDSYWRLTSYNVGQTNYIMSDTTHVRLHFGHSGELVGHGPCNIFEAKYEREENSGKLRVIEFTAPEKVCKEQDLEQQLFDLLRQADGYTVDDNGLVLFSPHGKLSFKPLNHIQVEELNQHLKLERLLGLLPPITAPVGPFYIYPTNREEALDSYPFNGQRVSEDLYDVFEEELADSWRTFGGYVYAIGRWENVYLFRIPGRYISSDIALFRLENNRMKRLETIAWMWCDEGWCHQQHAWLVDYDRDGRFDIINRYQHTNDKGQLVDDQIRAMRQLENGLFEEDPNLQVDPPNFQPGPVPMPEVK